jgi:hypothetical protein
VAGEPARRGSARFSPLRTRAQVAADSRPTVRTGMSSSFRRPSPGGCSLCGRRARSDRGRRNPPGRGRDGETRLQADRSRSRTVSWTTASWKYPLEVRGAPAKALCPRANVCVKPGRCPSRRHAPDLGSDVEAPESSSETLERVPPGRSPRAATRTSLRDEGAPPDPRPRPPRRELCPRRREPPKGATRRQKISSWNCRDARAASPSPGT